METTYEAIENAGVSLQTLKGSDTSVHVGAYATEWVRQSYLPQFISHWQGKFWARGLQGYVKNPLTSYDRLWCCNPL